MTNQEETHRPQGKPGARSARDESGRSDETRTGPGERGTGQKIETITGISEEIFEEAARERDDYLDSLKRLQADFENYRKRVMRESEQLKTRYSAEIIEEILPVLDNFERAMKAAMEHDQKVLGGGVELVYNQLRDVLNKRGLCEIEAHGQPFDPAHHEAVLCRPSEEHEEGTVVDVLEKGYRLEDRVVRPAKVVVSERKKEER